MKICTLLFFFSLLSGVNVAAASDRHCVVAIKENLPYNKYPYSRELEGSCGGRKGYDACVKASNLNCHWANKNEGPSSWCNTFKGNIFYNGRLWKCVPVESEDYDSGLGTWR